MKETENLEFNKLTSDNKIRIDNIGGNGCADQMFIDDISIYEK